MRDLGKQADPIIAPYLVSLPTDALRNCRARHRTVHLSHFVHWRGKRPRLVSVDFGYAGPDVARLGILRVGLLKRSEARISRPR
ncbi:hypothetical protein VTI74DRAFT_5028 [Chaetomium olivicolor]